MLWCGAARRGEKMKLDCFGMDTWRNENSDGGENLCFFGKTHGKFVGNSLLPLSESERRN
jgi:hypothetical protein